MQPVNIILGRFQPLTLGHLKCVDVAYKETGNDTVLAIIETPESKVDARHPFATNDILPMIKKQISETPHLVDYVLVKNADILKISEALREHGYELDSWTCGTDRYAGYESQCRGYWEKAGLKKEPRCIEVKRGDEDVSASAVRKALIDNDVQEFRKLMDKCWWGAFKELQLVIGRVTEHHIVPLAQYMLEALGRAGNEVQVSLQDLMDNGLWIPNDDLSHREYKELQDAVKEPHTWKGVTMTANPKDMILTFQYSNPKALAIALQDVCHGFTMLVYSVMGEEEGFEEYVKQIA